jgi:tetratricopeptide (TPR) repeat protein/SAM-dependent methyltransferase
MAEANLTQSQATIDIDDKFNQALLRHQAGHLDDAVHGYREILKEEPEHSGAIHMLIMALFQSGGLIDLDPLIDKALTKEVSEPAYKCNLGIVLQTLGRTQEAIECYRFAINLNPYSFEAHFNQGMLFQATGDIEAAIESYKSALVLNPNYTVALNNIGTLLTDSGCAEEGISFLEKLVSIDSGSAVGFNNLSRACYINGDLSKAVRYCQQAIRIKPDLFEANTNLAMLYFVSGKLEEAGKQYRLNLRMSNNKSPEGHANFGLFLLSEGKIEEALKNFLTATRISHENSLYWQYVCDALNLLKEPQVDDSLHEDLLHCLKMSNLDNRGAARIASNRLLSSETFSPWLSLSSQGHYNAILNGLGDDSLLEILEDPLLLGLLRSGTICMPIIETFLTLVRRALLQSAIEKHTWLVLIKRTEPFILALAEQCFLNEYVYYVTQHEFDQLTGMENELRCRPHDLDFDRYCKLALLGCYKPLHKLEWVDSIRESADASNIGQIAALIEYQVIGPLEELKLRTEMRELTPVVNSHSRDVKIQYETNPYPRWTGIKHLPAVPFAAYLKSICPGLRNVSLRIPRKPRILIAGCGSGQHAVQNAMVHPEGDIYALDISRNSLAYGMRMAHKFGKLGIKFIHGDILDIPQLEVQFHIVECVGVLHHMKSPWKGLGILADRLHKDGLILIGLYSKMARTEITATRRWVREKYDGPIIENIRKCRKEIIKRSFFGDTNDCLVLKDFYSTSECRDLLFHVHERTFTLPEIKIELNTLGLDFLGFQNLTPHIVNSYTRNFLSDPNRVDLDCWHQYELDHPDTFLTMYQFWVKRTVPLKSNKMV